MSGFEVGDLVRPCDRDSEIGIVRTLKINSYGAPSWPARVTDAKTGHMYPLIQINDIDLWFWDWRFIHTKPLEVSLEDYL